MNLIRRDPNKGLHLFYEAYGKLVQTTAQAVCRSQDKANEAVNDVLVKMWKLSGKTYEIENPEGWIYVVTLNTAKDVMREKSCLPLDENVKAADQTEELLDRSSFYWMIKGLSEEEQFIMIHKFVMQYTFREIAEELEKPLTTVTSTYYRALEKIKRNFE